MFASRVVERLDVQLAPSCGTRRGSGRRTGCAGPCRGRGSRSAARCPRAAIVSYSCAHRVGDREQVRLVARVVLVAEEQRHDARRGRGQERRPARRRPPARPAGARRRPARRLRVADADRPRCTRASCAASGRGRRTRASRGSGIRRGPGRRTCCRSPPKPAQPVLDVGRVARLAHLAVVDDVDAGLRPACRRPRATASRDASRERGGVDRHAFLLARTSCGSGRRAAAGCRCAWSGIGRCFASWWTRRGAEAPPV